jgi:hypothetical protein
MKEKMKWVSKYISRPLLVLVLILFLLYKFYPSFYTTLGIDIKDVAKYSFYFFLAKGIVWLFVIGWGVYYLAKKKKGKKEQ